MVIKLRSMALLVPMAYLIDLVHANYSFDDGFLFDISFDDPYHPDDFEFDMESMW